MLIVKKIINELMTSNCYIVYDEITKHCIIIDPASKTSLHEIDFVESNGLTLDYIILTHEHTDHTWGVNALIENCPGSKLVCSKQCMKNAPKASRAYFLFYYDDPNYRYVIKPADLVVEDGLNGLEWDGHHIGFNLTPGHSYGSMIIDIEGVLFTGDTIMPFKPFFNGRDSNEDDWVKSIEFIESKYDESTMIYPGHGDELTLGEWIGNKEYHERR